MSLVHLIIKRLEPTHLFSLILHAEFLSNSLHGNRSVRQRPCKALVSCPSGLFLAPQLEHFVLTIRDFCMILSDNV